MLVYPKEFHVKGNHEDHIVKEEMHKYDTCEKNIGTLQHIFCWLPLSNEKVPILHDGVSDRTDLELLAKLDRHRLFFP